MRYSVDETISPGQFVDLLERSTLAERRPVEEDVAIRDMLAHADLLVTAWLEDRLIGLARSVTDYSYCCYLSDLAVDGKLQRQGIGRELIRQTRAQLGPGCTMILLSAPAATEYYPRLGFHRHESAWILAPGDPLA